MTSAPRSLMPQTDLSQRPQKQPGANTLNAVGTDGSSNIETDTGDTEGGTPLYGNITITVEDVSNAVPGNYTGTTTFTISYSENGEDPDNPAERIRITRRGRPG